MTPLCTYHTSIVTAAVQAGHMNEDTAARLAADLANQCTPGRFWCPPLTPPTQEQA